MTKVVNFVDFFVILYFHKERQTGWQGCLTEFRPANFKGKTLFKRQLKLFLTVMWFKPQTKEFLSVENKQVSLRRVKIT